MKNFLVLIILSILTVVFTNAQPNWRNGKYFTPKDDFHVLVVFVTSEAYRFADDAGCNTIVFPPDHPSAGDPDTAARAACRAYYYNGFTTVAPTPNPITSIPQTSIIPTWAQREGFINSTKTLINTGYLTDTDETDAIMPYVNDDQFNISSYYKTMSFGKFNVTGDVVGAVIPNDVLSSDEFLGLDKCINNCSTPSYPGGEPTYTECNRRLIDEVISQLGLDPSQYDNRLNLPSIPQPCGVAPISSNFLDYNATILQNVGPYDKDQIIDYIAIIKKARRFNNGQWNESAGYVDGHQQSTLPNAIDSNGNQHDLGYYHVHDKTKDSKWSNMGLFIHEFAHNLGIPHNCNANGVVYDKFTATKCWGMIHDPIGNFWTATAQSMWLNGWLEDGDIHHIDPQNISNITIKLSDLLTTPLNNPTQQIPKNAARIKICLLYTSPSPRDS